MSMTRADAPMSESLKIKQNLVPFVTAIMTGTTIAATLYPIQYLQTRLQVGISSVKGGFFCANYRSIFSGLSKAMYSSWIKNGVISQKDHVHDQFHEALSEREMNFVFSRGMAVTMATACTIGFCDTTFTHPFKNYGIWNAVGHKPVFTNWQQRFQFIRNGYFPTLSGNVINASFCVGAKTIVEPFLAQYLPGGKNAFVNLAVTNLIAGSLSGIMVTPFQRVTRLQVHEVDTATYKAPSAMRVAKQLWRTSGYKSLFVGWEGNVAGTVIAFAIINGIEFEKYAHLLLGLDLSERKVLKSNPTLFSPAPAVAAPKTEEVAEKTVTTVPTKK